jgi:hypothetical protein
MSPRRSGLGLGSESACIFIKLPSHHSVHKEIYGLKDGKLKIKKEKRKIKKRGEKIGRKSSFQFSPH